MRRKIIARLVIIVLSCISNIHAELVTNGDFSNGLNNWFPWTYTGGGRTADFNVVGGELVVDNINGGGVHDWITILNSPVSLVQGTTYTISFDARSTVARPITVGPRRGGPASYDAYTKRVKLIDATMKTYTFTYTHTEASDPGAQLIFYLGETDDPVYMDNLSIVAGSTAGTGPTLKVLPIGDSISQGNLYGAGTYRKPLHFDMTDAGYNADFVGSHDNLAGSGPTDGAPDSDTGWDQDHEAWWGYTTSQLETILTSSILTYDFDVALIHLGTNDPNEAGIQNLKDIIDLLRTKNPNVVIFLAKLIAPNTNAGNKPKLIRDYNALIPGVVTEKNTPQSPVILVDQYTTLTPGTSDYVDGLHPTASGALKMAAVWLSAINDYYLDPAGPPAAPTGLTADGSDGSVSLDWSNNGEPDLMHYNIYRSTTSGSGYVSIYSGQTTSDYVDNSVVNGTTYYYVVTAVDIDTNESLYSTEASATPQSMITPPAAPTALSTLSGDASVSLDWADNTEPDLASYTVYRSTTQGSGYASIATGVAASDYVDDTAVNGTTYYYVVTAVDTSSSESGYSNEAAATPTAITGDFDIVLGSTELVPDTSPAGVPVYPWFPDGHITYIPDVTPGDYQMYWPGGSSYRTIGTSDTTMNDPGPAVIIPGAAGSYDNGGAWLMSVFRQSGQDMLGFYHAEDWEFPPQSNPDNIAWKSIAVCTSSDNGLSWTKGGQILTSATPKPSTPTWGGNGDHCVVYDAANARWVCYYSEHWLQMAVSYDPNGAPGTWYKYYNGDFTEPGLGGQNSPIPGLQSVSGANPSVHYNTYLNKWVMVWHSWDATSGSIWLSTSTDMINWDAPESIVASTGTEKKWYPTIIGTTDVEAGQQASLYYARWPDQSQWPRQFLKQTITFLPAQGPAAPMNLVATAGDGSVSLNWNDNTEPDLMHYDVYRSTISGSGYVSVYSGQTPSDYVDNSVANGMTYYYVVTATDTSSNESGYSNEDAATPTSVPDTTPPAAPANLVATAGNGSVSLNWNDNTEPDLMHYDIYRSTTSGSGYAAVYNGQTTSDYVDTSAVNGTTYYYVVTAVDTSSNESAQSAEASAQPNDWGVNLAVSETPVLGTVSGSLADIDLGDDLYEVITEVESGGSPANRRSQLEHIWTFDVASGELVTFYVEAHHTANSEGDDMVFAYSTDGVNYTDMVTVTKTADDNTVQFYVLPGGTSGTVYIRVVDANRTPGNRALDSIYVDAMFITSEAASQAPSVAASPAPADAATGVSLNPVLSWTAGTYASSHDVYFGSGPSPSFQGNQSGTSYSPGSLSASTTYYWAVDEVNGAGTTLGPVWSFTTAAAGMYAHVDSITLTAIAAGGPNLQGRATVVIVNQNSQPVQGATVTVTFSGDINEQGSSATDAAGQVVFTTGAKVKAPMNLTVTVDNVTHASYTYDPGANAQTSASGTFN